MVESRLAKSEMSVRARLFAQIGCECVSESECGTHTLQPTPKPNSEEQANRRWPLS